jgi:hypothetical protein
MSDNNDHRNSISKEEKHLIGLALGKIKPKTKRDKKILKEINEIKEKGGQPYIPHD